MEYLHFVRAHPRFLAFGVVAAGLSGFGQTFFIALFGGEIRSAFHLSHGDFGLLYSGATLLSGLGLVWAGWLLDRVDLRVFTACVVVALAVGSATLAMAATVAVAGLAVLLLRFTGQGLMMHIAFTSMGRYFEAGRGRAVSIAAMGLPLAEASLPPLAVAVADAVGWRLTWALVAGLLIAIALPLLQWLLHGHGERKRRLREATEGGEGGGQDWTRSQVLRDGRFYLLLPAVLGAPLVVTAMFFHQAHLAEIKGWPLSWLAASFVGFAVCHVFGLPVFGSLADRVGARRLLPFFLLPMAGGLLLVATLDGAWVAWPYMVLMGVTMGAAGTVFGALWPELYGVAHLGAIRALAQAAMVLATAIAPAAAGLLLDWGVSMEALAGWLSAYLALSCALAAGILRRTRPSGPPRPTVLL